MELIEKQIQLPIRFIQIAADLGECVGLTADQMLHAMIAMALAREGIIHLPEADPQPETHPMPTICPHCREDLTSDELVEKPVLPDSCHCDPKDWGDPTKIPNICHVFIPMSEDEPNLCQRCQHLRECHF